MEFHGIAYSRHQTSGQYHVFQDIEVGRKRYQKSGSLLLSQHTENSTSCPEPLFISTKLLGRESHHILWVYPLLNLLFPFFFPTFLSNFRLHSLSITAILSFLSVCSMQHWVTCCFFTFTCSHFFPFSSSYKILSNFATFSLWKLDHLFMFPFSSSPFFSFLQRTLSRK